MKKFILIFTVVLIGIALASCAQKRNQKPVIQGAVTDVTIEVGEDYDPLDGVVVIDEDKDLEIQIVGTYDVDAVGDYTFSLKVVDSDGLEHVVPIELHVVDSTSLNHAPVLQGVVANQIFFIGYADEYDPIAGVQATDAEDGTVTDITLVGQYDITTPGDYTLTVKATDSEGWVATKTIVLSVKYSTVPDQLSTETINITFMHAFGEEKEDIIEGYVTQFNQIYPNINITLSAQSGYDGLLSKVSYSIVAETEPTMLIGYPDHVASYLSAGAVEPLDAYVTHPEFGIDLSDFVQSYISENKAFDTAGTLYGLPFNKSTEVFIYNKTFFDSKGFTFPDNHSWNDVEDAAEIVKNVYPTTNDDYKDVYGFAYDSAANMFITLTKQWGGEYTSIDENRQGVVLFDDTEARSMINFFKNLESNQLMTLPQAWEEDYASTPFINEKVFMTVGSTAGINYNVPTGNAFELGILPIPQYSQDNKYVIQQGTNISIMKSATEQEKLAAWLFAKFLTSTDITADWAINTGYLPVRNTAYQSTEYQEFLNYQPDLTGLTGDDLDVALKRKYTSMAANAAYLQREYMFVDQPFIGSSDARAEVDLMLTQILVGHVDVETAINKALEEIDK